MLRSHNKRPYFWIRKHGGVHAFLGNWGWTAVVFGVLGPTTIGILSSSLPLTIRIVQGLVLLALWYGGISSILVDRPPGMAPYFDRRIGDIRTYSRGQRIAATCPRLDALATTIGVPPLSSFGFGDDFRGGTVVWHAAETGVKTFMALRAHLTTDQSNDALLTEELDLMVDALQKAHAKSAQFCLIITYGSTNSMEHEQRIGVFF